MQTCYAAKRVKVPHLLKEVLETGERLCSEFSKHEESMTHKEATMKKAASSSSSNIADILNAEHAAIQKFHMIMLMKLLSLV